MWTSLVSMALIGFLTSTVTIAHQGEHMGAASVELLVKPIELSSGMGKAYLVDNSSKLNQYINQSAAYLNTFDWVGAFRSAKEAYRINPQSAYAIAFQMLALLNMDPQNSKKYNLAFKQDLEKLLTEQKNMDAMEKLWSQLALGLYAADGEQIGSAFRSMLQLDGENLEVLTLANWMASQQPNMQLLLKALQLNIDHAGAHHYVGHMYEGSMDHDKALEHTRRFSELAPESSHAQHMYGHVLPHHNRWDEAIKQFEIAHQLHVAWGKKNQVDPGEDWHYSHNLHLMGTAYFANGQWKEGLEMLLEGCKYDPRSCKAFVEMAISSNQLDSATQVVNQIYANSAWKEIYLEEIRYFATGQATTAVRPHNNSHYFVLSFVIQTTPKAQALPENIVLAMREYFQTRLDDAGFDAWTTGLFELTRLVKYLKQRGEEALANEMFAILKTNAPNISLPEFE